MSYKAMIERKENGTIIGWRGKGALEAPPFFLVFLAHLYEFVTILMHFESPVTRFSVPSLALIKNKFEEFTPMMEKIRTLMR